MNACIIIVNDINCFSYTLKKAHKKTTQQFGWFYRLQLLSLIT